MRGPQGWSVLQISDRVSNEERAVLRDDQDWLEKNNQDELKGLYESFLHNRFNNLKTETKKRKLAALYRAFGTELNIQAVREIFDISRGYHKDFRVCESIHGRVFRYNAEEYSHENGDPAIVLQRSNRRSISVPTKIRRKVIARDNEECLRCGSSGDLEVHHILPVSRGGSHEQDNLATLCSDCHNAARLSNPQGGEVSAYPKGKFEAWLDDALEICGAKTSDHSLCQNPRGSCPHHD